MVLSEYFIDPTPINSKLIYTVKSNDPRIVLSSYLKKIIAKYYYVLLTLHVNMSYLNN